MSKIRVKNFGPIKEGYLENDGWIDLKKVTIFIGNQGSGKSTLAKVISTLLWMEKALNRKEITVQTIHDFQLHFSYQNIKSYFNENTLIEYEGDCYRISYDLKKNQFPKIEESNQTDYKVPKIIYIPAERNILSVIKSANGVKGLPEPLFDFAEELKTVQLETKGEDIQLPINGVSYRYDIATESSFIIGENYQENLLRSSSGFQSFVPLFLVSRSRSAQIQKGSKLSSANISVNQSIRMNEEISRIMLLTEHSPEIKDDLVKKIQKRFINSCLINIVEEPEQNLFPSSQKMILNSLLEFNNSNKDNKLIITTHSPYFINYLTLAVEAHKLKQKVTSDTLKAKLNIIVPLDSTVNGEDLAVYQLNEISGVVTKLKTSKGLPSDDNYLNQELGESNDLFSELLEIEDLCQ